jgi:hypothetical protein
MFVTGNRKEGNRPGYPPSRDLISESSPSAWPICSSARQIGYPGLAKREWPGHSRRCNPVASPEAAASCEARRRFLVQSYRSL